ncbi:ABC transporter substrate-binding protein [Ornithinibacillus sp. 4-3]|uniref:ABC transporter substrate-binding protein n=1 Tax=Ornithinibacillus sp. 4-3 TaxID=3231488 RepID=A0AB39HUF9_9BACI
MQLKKIGSLLLLLTLGIALISCSTSTGDVNQNKKKDEALQGGKLDFAYHVQPLTLDPHFTTSDATRDISNHIYEGLLTLNSSLEVAPMLAESYEVSEDGNLITFYLRKGIKFHNGQEMKAKDVIASLERWQSLSSQALTYLADTKYESKDDYTVIAHIDNPTTLDLYIFSDITQFAAIMPEEIIKSASVDGVNEYVGTGPYAYKEWKQDHYIHLEKFSEYQSRNEPADGMAGEKKAYLDDIYFHIITDPSTRLAGLQSGEYAIAGDIPPDSALKLLDNPDFKNSIDSSSFTPMVFNKKTGVFSNQKARQAANAAINAEDVLKAAYVDEQFYEMDHALVKTEQTGWYSDVGSDIYNTYDPELSKKLLDEAGYNGEEVVMLTSREYANYYNMSLVIREQLEAVGMNVKLEVTDWATVLKSREDENKFDLFFTNFTIRPIPIQYLFMNSEWLGWTDSDDLKRISEGILYASSIEEAQEYSDELHQVFWEYLPVFKPGNIALITSMNKNVEGFQSISNPILWNVSITE